MVAGLFLAAASAAVVPTTAAAQGYQQGAVDNISSLFQTGVDTVVAAAIFHNASLTNQGSNAATYEQEWAKALIRAKLEDPNQLIQASRQQALAAAIKQQVAFSFSITSSSGTTASSNTTPTLELDFQKAAQEFNFSEDFLKAVSFPLSNWEQNNGKPSIDGGFGIMHLINNSAASQQTDRLTQAAQLIGVDPALLKTDPLLNIRAGAALLRNMAHLAGISDKETSLAALAPVLATWSGFQPGIDQLYIDQVFKLLHNGFSHRISSGETLQVLAQTGLPATAPHLPSAPTAKVRPNAAINGADYPPAIVYPVADEPGVKYDYGRTATLDSAVIGFGEGQSRGTLLELVQYYANSSNPDKSVHYVVGLDGTVYQLVAEANTAYYLGHANPTAPNGRTYDNANIIGISLEGVEGDTPNAAMYSTLANMLGSINNRRSNIALDCNSFVGLSTANPSFGNNPGGAFDWSQILPNVTSDCKGITNQPHPPRAINGSYGFSRYMATAGEPVNLSNGNFVYKLTLFSTPGNNLPLTIDLTYNSLDNSTGSFGFGPGWSASLDTELWANPKDGSVAIYYADGRSTTFMHNSDGSFTEQPGYFDHLVKNTNGSFTVTRPDQTVWQFNSSGKLTAQSERNGNHINYSYDSSSSGHLNNITDSAGRNYSLAWDTANNKLLTITDSANRQIKLSYANGGTGSLENFTDFNGSVTHFSYDGQHRVSAVTDGRGSTFITNSYDGQGRINQQTDPNGKTFRFEYAPNSTRFYDQDNNSTLYQFDNAGHPVQITDAMGGVTLKTYDADDNLTQLVTPAGHQWHYTYDNNGNLTTVTDPQNHLTTMVYDNHNNIIKVTDAIGGITSYQYDNVGNLITSQRPDGSIIHISYDGQGRPLVLTDGRNSTTKFSYDAAGNLIQVTDALNATSHYEYDSVGHLVAVSDELGRRTVNNYDANGNRTQITDALGRITKFEYDANNNQTALVDRTNNRYTMSYNFNNQQTQLVDPLGHAINSSYNATLYLDTQTKARGDATHYTYDALHRVIGNTDALGHLTAWSYDADGNLIKKVAPDGGVTIYQNDELGHLLCVTDALNNKHCQTYDGLGRVSSSTDGRGNVTHYSYDGMGRLLTVTYPAPITGTEHFDYDANGNLTKRTDTLNRVTQYQYDADNHLVKTIDPASQATTYQYDAAGQLLSTTNPAGHATQMQYDAGGRVIKMLDALGNPLNFEYDNEDRPTKMVDELGHITTMHYDSAGRMVKMSNPANGVLTFSYDENGNLIGQTSAAGRSQSFSYDLANQLSTTTDGLNRVTKLGYDLLGHVNQITDPAGHVTQFAYDALGRRIAVKDAKGGVTTMSYDSEGNLVQTVDPIGAITKKSYDSLNRLISQTDTLDFVTTNTYDDAGQLLSIKKPDGGISAMQYDALGRMVKLTAPQGGVTTIQYDVLGNPTKITDAVGNVEQRQYDTLNRLTATVDGDGFSWLYQYNAVGKLTKTTDPLGHINTTEYNTLDQITKMVNGVGSITTFGYDADGLLTTKTDANNHTITYQYDAARQLIASTSARGATTKLQYDVAGNISAVTNTFGKSTSFSYDALDQLIATTNPLGQTNQLLRDAASRVIASQDPKGAITHYSYDGLGQLLGVKDAQGGVSSYTYDGDGNKLSYKDARGNTERWQYNNADQMIADTDPLNHAWHYNYDLAGRLSSLVDANQQRISFGYNKRNQQVAVYYPDNFVEDYSYDGAGNLVYVGDRNGQSGFGYDEANRLTSEKRVSQGTSQTVYAAYDPVGNQIALNLPNHQSETWTYNADNQLISVTDPSNGVFNYTKDLLGRTTNLAYPNGIQKVQSYNDANQLTSLTYLRGPATRASLVKRSEFTRDPNGQITQIKNLYPNVTHRKIEAAPVAKPTTSPVDNSNLYTEGDDTDQLNVALDETAVTNAINGDDQSVYLTPEQAQSDKPVQNSQIRTETTSYTYDQSNRLTSQSDSSGRKISYSLDANGNITDKEVSKTVEGQTYSYSQSMSYDVSNHLIGMAEPNGASLFSYDANGNRISQVAPGNKLTAYNYDFNNRLTAVSIGRVYDEHGRSAGVESGNMPASTNIKDTTTINSGNSTGNASNGSNSSSDSSSAIQSDPKRPHPTPLKNIATYSYDGLGRLRTIDFGKQNLNSASDADVSLSYWGTTRIGQTSDGTHPGWNNTYFTSGERGQVLGATTYTPTHDERDRSNGTASYFLSDQLGSVLSVTNKNGKVVGSQGFGAYGSLNASNGDAKLLHEGFTGQIYDDSTGLTNFNARWYDGSTGRWLTDDKYRGMQANPLSQNRSLYVRANPINLTDPFGFFDDATGTIQRGDNLWNIVKSHYGLANIWANIRAVQEANNIADAGTIYAGNHLYLPNAGYTRPSRSSGGNSGNSNSSGNSSFNCSYTVQHNDYLSTIAEKFGLGGDYMSLARANGISNPNYIQTGQILRVPCTNPSSGNIGGVGSNNDGNTGCDINMSCQPDTGCNINMSCQPDIGCNINMSCQPDTGCNINMSCQSSVDNNYYIFVTGGWLPGAPASESWDDPSQNDSWASWISELQQRIGSAVAQVGINWVSWIDSHVLITGADDANQDAGRIRDEIDALSTEDSNAKIWLMGQSNGGAAIMDYLLTSEEDDTLSNNVAGGVALDSPLSGDWHSTGARFTRNTCFNWCDRFQNFTSWADSENLVVSAVYNSSDDVSSGDSNLPDDLAHRITEGTSDTAHDITLNSPESGGVASYILDQKHWGW
jgi:RHS repeat-associated protein